MKLRKLAKQNYGFSLVELIVVVAILGACIGLITANINAIPAREAQRCANEIDAALSRCKIESMAKGGNASMVLECRSDGYYLTMNAGALTETDKIANRRCTVNCGGTMSDSSNNTRTFSFQRSTGAFDAGSDISEITVTGGGRTYKITLYKLTGAHEIGRA